MPIESNKRKSGENPYYGANGIQDYIEGYTHFGDFVLIAEDGASDIKNYPVRYVSGKFWANNHVHILSDRDCNIDSLFLSSELKTFNFIPYLSGNGRAKLTKSDLETIILNIPNLDEQQHIGELLNKIDEIIDFNECNKKSDISKEMPDTIAYIRLNLPNAS